MNINLNTTSKLFNKFNLAIFTLTVISNNLIKQHSNLDLPKALNVILKRKSLIDTLAGKIVITRPDLLQEILAFSKKEILAHKYIYLFDIATIKIYGLQSKYFWYLINLFLAALIKGLRRFNRMIRRFIYNWLNILISKSDFLIWFKYFCKKLVYRYILKEEIQHSRWIKHATTSTAKTINLPTFAHTNNPIDGSIRDDGIVITEEDYEYKQNN